MLSLSSLLLLLLLLLVLLLLLLLLLLPLTAVVCRRPLAGVPGGARLRGVCLQPRGARPLRAPARRPAALLPGRAAAALRGHQQPLPALRALRAVERAHRGGVRATGRPRATGGTASVAHDGPRPDPTMQHAARIHRIRRRAACHQ